MKKRLRLKEKKRISRDCWSLDYAFLDWLKPRIKCYLKEAGKYVDLDYHTFEYNEKTMTQKEILVRMIEILDKYDDTAGFSYFVGTIDESEKLIKELLDLFCLVFPVLWW